MPGRHGYLHIEKYCWGNMNLFTRALSLASVGLLVLGCATVKTDELTVEEAVGFEDKTVVLSQYDQLPDFPAQTATNVQFGMIGFATAVSNGNAMIEENGIQDPAREISRQLAEGLEKNFNLKVINNEELVANSKKLTSLVEVYQGYDYILDVRTLGWGSTYFPTDWNSYRVMYSAHARLIDASSQEVIAEELCNFKPEFEDTNDAPSYDDLKSGEGLKRELDKSVAHCVEYIATMAKFHHQQEVQTMAVSE